MRKKKSWLSALKRIFLIPFSKENELVHERCGRMWKGTSKLDYTDMATPRSSNLSFGTKAMSNATHTNRAVQMKAAPLKDSSRPKLRMSSSFKIATSFTQVCLWAPISFRVDHQSRRSYGNVRSKPKHLITPQERSPAMANGRRVFRGKSLTDDVLMRRFVVEEAAMVQARRRCSSNFVRKRKLGNSLLSRMSMVRED